MLAVLARSLGELDRFIPGVLVIKQLASQPGAAPRANLILGELYEMMNAPAQAATAFQRGLEKAGKLIEPGELTRKRKQLARCLLRLAKPGEAHRALEANDGP